MMGRTKGLLGGLEMLVLIAQSALTKPLRQCMGRRSHHMLHSSWWWGAIIIHTASVLLFDWDML